MPHKHKLREIMKETGLTQAELAPKLGVTFAALNRWLGGKATPRQAAKERIDNLYSEYTRKDTNIMIMKNHEKTKEIAQKYGLRLLILFGSRARGDAYPNSDYDVGFISNSPLTFDQEIMLNVDLCAYFKNENVQQVDLRKAPPLLLYIATNEGKVLFESDEFVLPTLQSYAYKRFVETQPLFELAKENLTSNI